MRLYKHLHVMIEDVWKWNRGTSKRVCDFIYNADFRSAPYFSIYLKIS